MYCDIQSMRMMDGQYACVDSSPSLTGWRNSSDDSIPPRPPQCGEDTPSSRGHHQHHHTGENLYVPDDGKLLECMCSAHTPPFTSPGSSQLHGIR